MLHVCIKPIIFFPEKGSKEVFETGGRMIVAAIIMEWKLGTNDRCPHSTVALTTKL